MADRYVYSGAAGTGTGASWANAHTTLAAANTASTAGDRFFVAHDHTETFAVNTTLTFKGTSGAPDQVYGVNRAGSVPPVKADLIDAAAGTNGPLFATTGTATLTINGAINCRGIRWKPIAAMTIGNIFTWQRFEQCQFWMNGSATITMSGGQWNMVEWRNCTWKPGNVNARLAVNNDYWRWKNDRSVPAMDNSVATPLQMVTAPNGRAFEFIGLDLSQFSNGVLQGSGGSGQLPEVTFANCKLHASAAPIQYTASPALLPNLNVINCDSGTGVLKNARYNYGGTITTETTIVRTGGESYNGTPYSWKLVSNANNKLHVQPLQTFEGHIENTAVGSAKTLTVHVVTDNVTLTDQDIWLEVDYMDNSGTVMVTSVIDGSGLLGTAANQTSDSGTGWTTTGLTTPVKQKLDVTFTPQLAGPIRWRVVLAKASVTVYVDPAAELT